MSLPPYSFRAGSEFLARENLENMMTLFFSGMSFILHLAHHFANFRRSLRKSFAPEKNDGERKIQMCPEEATARLPISHY